MKCFNCGSELKPNYVFCIRCGAKTAGVPPPPQAIPPYPKPVVHEQRPKGKKIKRIVLTSLFVLLLTLGIVFLVRSFPLDVSCISDTKTTTTSTIKDMRIEIQSNQIITGVLYAVDPLDPDNLKEYSKISPGKGLFSKYVTMPEFKVPAGLSNLYIYTSTLFGHEVTAIPLMHDIGYTSAPDEDAIIFLGNGQELVSNELIISANEGVSKRDIERIVETYGGEIVGELYYLNRYLVRFDGYGESYISYLRDELLESSLIKSISFNMASEVSVDKFPNDEKWDDWDVSKPGGNNWGLECIDAPGAWDLNDEMTVVKVGVIDTVLDANHEDLQINPGRLSILPTEDFSTLEDLQAYYDQHANSILHTDEDHDTEECILCRYKDHGTHCSGIISAVANNQRGISGVNWNTDLYFTTGWYYYTAGEGMLGSISTDFSLCYSISQLVMSGCRVLNLSFEFSEPTPPPGEEGEDEGDKDIEKEREATRDFDEMIRKLEKDGYDFLLVKAAGNENDDASNYRLNRIMTNSEAGRRHTIIVGAIGNWSKPSDYLASWLGDLERIYSVALYSNYGDLIDVMAPGSGIYSTTYGDQYRNASGTSMAAPMTAGVASLMYSLDPTLTYDTVKTIVCNTSKNFSTKKGEVYGIVNAKNAVEWIRLPAGDSSIELPVTDKPVVGFITGLIGDAKTLEPLNDVSIRITNTKSREEFVVSVDEGFYESMLAPGIYDMEFVAENYVTESVNGIEIIEGAMNYNVYLHLVEDSQETGKARGRVVDAFDASAVPNAQMKFFKGINQTQGTAVATTTSDQNGKYSIELEPGNYTAHISANGYLADYSSILIIGGETKDSQDCTLTPILKDGEARIVLTWGQYPRDLDSHLVGPTPAGEQFHTYYHRKNHRYDGVLYANLDVDDTTSYGPETTSIYVGVGGTYTYYVHDYTNRHSTSSSALATSSAQVKVYIAGAAKPLVYNVPNLPGTLWTVCSINNGKVTPINTMGYESNVDRIGR